MNSKQSLGPERVNSLCPWSRQGSLGEGAGEGSRSGSHPPFLCVCICVCCVYVFLIVGIHVWAGACACVHGGQRSLPGVFLNHFFILDFDTGFLTTPGSFQASRAASLHTGPSPTLFAHICIKKWETGRKWILSFRRKKKNKNLFKPRDDPTFPYVVVRHRRTPT